MNKRLRKKNSIINKKQTRNFVIMYDATTDTFPELDLYKDIYHNPQYPYALFNEGKWDALYRILRLKGFKPKSNGEDFHMFWAIYNDKLPIYLKEINILQYNNDGYEIEPLIIKNNEKNSIRPKISEFFILSRDQGNDKYFPKHNKENTVRYILKSIEFLFKGYSFELKHQSRIITNAPNHIIEQLIKKTKFFGYLRTDDED